MKNTVLILFACLTPWLGRAQFQNISDQLDEMYVTSNAVFGSGLSYFDFDNDGWDDLTIGRGADGITFLKNDSGTFVPASFSIPSNGPSAVIMVLWADYDNDGDNDLLVTRNNANVELWQNDGAFNFTNVAVEAGITTGSYYHSGATFADFDHDGCLDLYICKFYNQNFQEGYEYHNVLYRSNCDGTFTDVTIEAGVDVIPHLTFQAVFFDYNKDGWEDLYLINELAEFVNHLFENNGDGTFTEVTESTGAGIYICAMSGTVGDFNNDAHLDVFVTNRTPTGGNHLLIDDGTGQFTNQAPVLGFGTDYVCWGATWLDYDNDGWEDIFVSIPNGSDNYEGNEFYINHQGDSVTAGREMLGFGDDFSRTYVPARGDMDNDGYFDLAHSSTFLTPFQLYQNQGGANNHLSFTLEGTLSNRNGIGTWIYCYSGTEMYTRYTMCGENLIGQNSAKQIFGLGAGNQVDSLVIEWNSGTREVYTELITNNHYHFVEGMSFSEPIDISTSGSTTLCEGDTVSLYAGEYPSYLWNTGDTTASITVEEAGEYAVVVTNEFGLEVNSNTVVIETAPQNEVLVETNMISCTDADDGTISLALADGAIDSLFWNTGESNPDLNDLTPGLYSYFVVDGFGCEYSGTVSIDEPSPLLGQVTTTPVLCFGDSTGTASLNILGGTPPYSTEWLLNGPGNLQAGSYSVSVADTNGCEIELDYSITQPDSLWADLFVVDADPGANNGSATVFPTGGTSPYSILWSNDVEDQNSIDGLQPGDYSVLVSDANDCTFQHTFVIGVNTSLYIGENIEGIRFYPNPANASLYITSDSGIQIWVRLYNLTGQLVQSAQFSGLLQFNTTTLPSGVYLLELASDTQFRRERVHVVH